MDILPSSKDVPSSYDLGSSSLPGSSSASSSGFDIPDVHPNFGPFSFFTDVDPSDSPLSCSDLLPLQAVTDHNSAKIHSMAVAIQFDPAAISQMFSLLEHLLHLFQPLRLFLIRFSLVFPLDYFLLMPKGEIIRKGYSYRRLLVGHTCIYLDFD